MRHHAEDRAKRMALLRLCHREGYLNLCGIERGEESSVKFNDISLGGPGSCSAPWQKFLGLRDPTSIVPDTPRLAIARSLHSRSEPQSATGPVGRARRGHSEMIAGGATLKAVLENLRISMLTPTFQAPFQRFLLRDADGERLRFGAFAALAYAVHSRCRGRSAVPRVS
jgi:hypothetical protein